MPLRSDVVSTSRSRFLLMGLLMALLLAVASPARAQDGSSGDPDPVADADVFDENESEATIEWVTFTLVGIAVCTGLLLVLYIWHTSPRRRLRVATRRRERRDEGRQLDFDDEFLLPADVDDRTDPTDGSDLPVDPVASED